MHLLVAVVIDTGCPQHQQTTRLGSCIHSVRSERLATEQLEHPA